MDSEIFSLKIEKSKSRYPLEKPKLKKKNSKGRVLLRNQEYEDRMEFPCFHRSVHSEPLPVFFRQPFLSWPTWNGRRLLGTVQRWSS